jgi:hypothetical protein
MENVAIQFRIQPDYPDQPTNYDYQPMRVPEQREGE